MTNWKERWAKAVFLWLILPAINQGCAEHGPESSAQGPAQAAAQSPAPTPPQPPAQAPAQSPAPFKPEEIEALVAPIALYPDPVLAQVLMASTYPLEIVHAARWVKENPKVKGEAAVKAVENQPWDTSVKSMVAFPQILGPMNDKLDWTQRLGDAFLAQQKDVFAAVQRLRARAQESGNLKSNEQQSVMVEPAPAGSSETTIVRIEPANPEVIYVPAYDPVVVYGGWGYPAYPPTYWPPYPAYYPGYYPGAGLAFGLGLAAAAAIYSNCNWGGGDINIDVNRGAHIDHHFDRSKVQGQGGRWQHDAGHREGVAYRDNATRDKFAGQAPGGDRRSEYRGRGTEGGVANRDTRADRSFSGVGSGGRTAQRNYDRGRSSTQGSNFNRPAGGGMRGGGARGGRR